MKADFSRDTFNPLKHFSRVLMQQGRVQLDADWNEQTPAILLHYLRSLGADLIGPHGGPADVEDAGQLLEVNCGFEIITDPDRIDLCLTTRPRKEKLKELLERCKAGPAHWQRTLLRWWLLV
jgi:hypothetical protein